MSSTSTERAARRIAAGAVAFLVLASSAIPGAAMEGPDIVDLVGSADAAEIRGDVLRIPAGAVVQATGPLRLVAASSLRIDGILLGAPGQPLALLSGGELRVTGTVASGPGLDAIGASRDGAAGFRGKDGGDAPDLVLESPESILLDPGAAVLGGAGGAGASLRAVTPVHGAEALELWAGAGGKGGTVVLAAPTVRIGGIVRPGPGGPGGVAVADLGEAPGLAEARAHGGPGGPGGDVDLRAVLALIGRAGLPGADGGAGGGAWAVGSPGVDACGDAGVPGRSATATNGDPAIALGTSGAAGSAGCSPGGGGGAGGNGGSATATGVNRGKNCEKQKGGNAAAYGGGGGNGGKGAAGSNGAAGTGNGGNGQAGGNGGDGGSAGSGGPATAAGGKGSTHRTLCWKKDGNGGDATAFAGSGGVGGGGGPGGNGGKGANGSPCGGLGAAPGLGGYGGLPGTGGIATANAGQPGGSHGSVGVARATSGNSGVSGSDGSNGVWGVNGQPICLVPVGPGGSSALGVVAQGRRLSHVGADAAVAAVSAAAGQAVGASLAAQDAVRQNTVVPALHAATDPVGDVAVDAAMQACRGLTAAMDPRLCEEEVECEVVRAVCTDLALGPGPAQPCLPMVMEAEPCGAPSSLVTVERPLGTIYVEDRHGSGPPGVRQGWSPATAPWCAWNRMASPDSSGAEPAPSCPTTSIPASTTSA